MYYFFWAAHQTIGNREVVQIYYKRPILRFYDFNMKVIIVISLCRDSLTSETNFLSQIKHLAKAHLSLFTAQKKRNCPCFQICITTHLSYSQHKKICSLCCPVFIFYDETTLLFVKTASKTRQPNIMQELKHEQVCI